MVQSAYAMPSTDIAYAAIGLRMCYAMSAWYAAAPGTDLAYFGGIPDSGTVTSVRVREDTLFEGAVLIGAGIVLRACYAMSGTDAAHGGIGLRNIQY
eukprot:2266677-Rhodomonas_salina.6